jgi:hypothetical protein
MYGIALPQTLTPTPKGIYQISDIANNDKECIAALEQELFMLRSGKPFSRTDNHHNAATTSRPLAPNVPALGPPVVQRPAGPAILTPPSTSSMATNSSTSTSQPPVHPYTSAKENAYLSPHECNFASGLKGKEREGLSYHTQAPNQNEKIVQDIFSHSMKTPIVTLTSAELLSLSPEV